MYCPWKKITGKTIEFEKKNSIWNYLDDDAVLGPVVIDERLRLAVAELERVPWGSVEILDNKRSYTFRQIQNTLIIVGEK